jgi:hypothetical protein
MHKGKTEIQNVHSAQSQLHIIGSFIPVFIALILIFVLFLFFLIVVIFGGFVRCCLRRISLDVVCGGGSAWNSVYSASLSHP